MGVHPLDRGAVDRPAEAVELVEQAAAAGEPVGGDGGLPGQLQVVAAAELRGRYAWPRNPAPALL